MPKLHVKGIDVDELGTTKSSDLGTIAMTSNTIFHYISIGTEQQIWRMTDTIRRHTRVNFTSQDWRLYIDVRRLQSGLLAATKDSLCEM